MNRVCKWMRPNGSLEICGQTATHEECVKCGRTVKVVRDVCNEHRLLGEMHIRQFGWRDGFYRPIEAIHA